MWTAGQAIYTRPAEVEYDAWFYLISNAIEVQLMTQALDNHTLFNTFLYIQRIPALLVLINNFSGSPTFSVKVI